MELIAEFAFNQEVPMKSVKPGRGPSGMSFIGSLVTVVFGIIWTVIAFGISSAAPFGFVKIFPLFGIVFVVFGIISAMYNYKNATGKDRYSIFDITDSKEEGDPAKWIRHDDSVHQFYGGNDKKWERVEGNDIRKDEVHTDEIEGYFYCPYCGTPLESDFSFCPKCGRDV